MHVSYLFRTLFLFPIDTYLPTYLSCKKWIAHGYVERLHVVILLLPFAMIAYLFLLYFFALYLTVHPYFNLCTHTFFSSPLLFIMVFGFVHYVTFFLSSFYPHDPLPPHVVYYCLLNFELDKHSYAQVLVSYTMNTYDVPYLLVV